MPAHIFYHCDILKQDQIKAEDYLDWLIDTFYTTAISQQCFPYLKSKVKEDRMVIDFHHDAKLATYMNLNHNDRNFPQNIRNQQKAPIILDLFRLSVYKTELLCYKPIFEDSFLLSSTRIAHIY